MPYVDLAGLSRYASRQKDRLERDCALLRDMQWLRTEKAGAVSLWPVGGTPLKPVVDFLFSETPPASGDKGPSNPSTITGVDSIFIRRTSENFVTTPYKWFADSQSTSYTDHGLTYTLNSDNSITINGTADGTSYFALLGEDGQNVWFPAGTYTIKAPNISTSLAIVFYYGSSVSVYTTDTVRTFTNGFYGRIYYRVANRTTVNNVVVYPQVFFNAEEASTFSVVPNYASTLPLGNTYYGGTLDAASGVMTVTHFGVVFDGVNVRATDHPGTIGTNYRHVITLSTQGFPKATSSASSSNQASTHFSFLNGLTGVFGTYVITGNYIIIHDKDGLYPDSASFNAWLAAQHSAGTPVSFVYTVETPYTVQLDPVSISALVQADKYTPRINTVYTDASAVQVGYVKSPIREEQELTQAIAAQGGNV